MIVIERREEGKALQFIVLVTTHKVCHCGERCSLTFFLPLAFCLPQSYLLSLSPTAPSSPLSPPHLFAATSLSLVPKSFQSSDWFFCLVPPSLFHRYPPPPRIAYLGTFHPFVLPHISLFSHCQGHTEPHVWEDCEYIHSYTDPSTDPSILSIQFFNSFVYLFMPLTNILESLLWNRHWSRSSG